MAKTIACLALVEFTKFVEGHGMIVGAPESSLDEAKRPEVPEHVIDRFIKDGLIKAPKGWAKASEEAPADAPADAPAPEGDAAP